MKVEWNKLGHRFEFDDWTVKRLRDIYPFFDKELLKMEMWYIANPKKQKKNHYRFIVNWLNRVKINEGPPKPQAPPRDYKKEEIAFRHKMEIAIKEAAPPNEGWRELMDKLKPRGI